MTKATLGAWTRRGILRAGVLGGLFSSYVGLSVALQPTRRWSEAKQGEPVLDAEEYSILCALADRVCPAAGSDSPGALARGVPKELVRQLSLVPPEAQQAFKLALRIVENPLLGLLSGERCRPFTQLSGADKDQVLASFRDSSLPFKRAVYSALRGAVSAVYYGDEFTWTRIGYSGPPNPSVLRAANPDLLIDYESLRGTAS